MSEESFGVCSVEDMKDLLALKRYAKQAGWLTQAGQKKPLIQNVPGLYIAVVTTEITARSGTTPGTGEASLRYMPGAATTISNYPSTADVITVKNMATTSVAVGRYIVVLQESASWQYVLLNTSDACYVTRVYINEAETQLLYDTSCETGVLIDTLTQCDPDTI
jgi:hypothetical protein